METYFRYLEEFSLFLSGWHFHLPSTAFATVVWLATVTHLLVTGHATLHSNGVSDDIGCGDSRVWRAMVIFGGPTGLSFGLPYYWLMNAAGFAGWFKEYWLGFIYVQFFSSILQLVLLAWFALFGPRSKNWWRFFKAHLKGCGWVSSLSPIGWILYVIQQFLPNRAKISMWLIRDIETCLVFGFNLVATPLLPICAVASILNQRLIVPMLWWIDEDHKEDEDSSEE